MMKVHVGSTTTNAYISLTCNDLGMGRLQNEENETHASAPKHSIKMTAIFERCRWHRIPNIIKTYIRASSG